MRVLLLSGAASFGLLTGTGHARIAIALALLPCIGVGAYVAVQDVPRTLLFVFATLAVVAWQPAPFDLLIVFLLPFCWFRRDAGRQMAVPRWMLVWLTLFCLGQAASTMVSPYPADSARWSLISIFLTIVALVAYEIGRRRDLLTAALLGYVGGAVLSTCLGLFALTGVLNLPVVLKTGIRLQGFYKDPNVFGPYVAMAIVILVAFPFEATREGRLVKRIRPVLQVILVAGVLFSYSRGAWAYLVFSLALYAGLRTLRSPRLIPKFTLIVVTLLFFVPLGIFLLQRDPNSYLLSRFGLQSYDQDRFATRDRSLAEFTTHPIFGHGSGISFDVWGYDPHNVYTRLLFENGLVGFCIATLLIGVAIFRAVRTALYVVPEVDQRLAAAFAAGLLGIAAESFVIDTLHWRNLWLLIGWAWAAGEWGRVRPPTTDQPASAPGSLATHAGLSP